MSEFKLSELFKESVRKHDNDSILSSFAVLLNTDRSFEKGKADAAIEYIKEYYPDFIKRDTGEKFKDENDWNGDYWADISVSLYDYFSLEKIEQLKKMSKKLYPAKEKTYDEMENYRSDENSKKEMPALAMIGVGVGVIAAAIIIAIMNR